MQGEKAKHQLWKLFFAPGRVTSHRFTHTTAPSTLPALAFPLLVPVLAPQLWLEALLPPSKQQGQPGKCAGMESPGNCLLMAQQHQGIPQPQGLGIRALNIMEISFLQPSQLGCWLGFLKQSLASSLAAPELVYLVRLVRRTTLIPISSYLDGRSLVGSQHHTLQLGTSGSQSFSPHPTH